MVSLTARHVFFTYRIVFFVSIETVCYVCDRRGVCLSSFVMDQSAFPGEKAQFCSMHKKPGMVDVHNKRCEAHGCQKHPTYGLANGRAKFCTKHKAPEMVSMIFIPGACEYRTVVRCCLCAIIPPCGSCHKPIRYLSYCCCPQSK